MGIEDTRELKTVTAEIEANQLLGEGWTLLALFDRRNGADQYTEYHLGRPGGDAQISSGALLVPPRMRK